MNKNQFDWHKIVENCHDCNAKPGETHILGCDVEICSVCGHQWIGCGHKGHDQKFARWTGFWPGYLESKALGIDLNDFYFAGFSDLFFIKPKILKEGINE